MKDINNIVQVISFVNVPGTGQCGHFSAYRVQNQMHVFSWIQGPSCPHFSPYHINKTSRSGLFCGHQKHRVEFRLWWHLNLFNAPAILPLFFFFFIWSINLAILNHFQIKSSQVPLVNSCATVPSVLLKHLEWSHTFYVGERLDG